MWDENWKLTDVYLETKTIPLLPLMCIHTSRNLAGMLTETLEGL